MLLDDQNYFFGFSFFAPVSVSKRVIIENGALCTKRVKREMESVFQMLEMMKSIYFVL